MPVAADPCRVPSHVFCAGAFKEMQVMPAPHAHSQVELNFLLDGAVTYRFGGHDVALAAGDFVFFWGAVPHQTVAVAAPTHFVCIYVPVERFLLLPLSARLTAAVLGGAMVAPASRETFAAGQLTRLHEEVSGNDSRLVDLDRAEIEHMLRRVDVTGWRDLLGAGEAAAARRPAALGRAVAMARFMTDHAAEPIEVADVALRAGLHPNYAMRVFRDAFGLTIGAYLLRQRLQRAQAALTATTHPISEVAFESGFGSVSRFHAAFRGHFGVSPRRFRAARQAS